MLLPFRPAASQECVMNAHTPRTLAIAYASGRSDASRRGVLLQPGADGTLIAKDETNGRELWSFTPPGLDGTHLFDGLMSDVSVLRYDANRDGTIDPAAGDRIWIYFGMRRGGRIYYALDASDRDRVRLLWSAGPAELPGVGETWSAPVTGRVRIAGERQNGEHLVVIVGGGYDDAAASGHRIYMMDAADGHLLWYAAGPAGVEAPIPPALPLSQMTASIPGRIAAVDTDNDGFTDRMYAADTAGRLWRFDISNGAASAELVAGGILASLGADGSALPTQNRQFFNGPDVALMYPQRGTPYYNLAIGSGDRAHPFLTQTHDRLYSIRDHSPFMRMSQAAYDASIPIVDADLIDLTDHASTPAFPPGAAGWRMDLRAAGYWAGEKSLAEALTLEGVALFTSFEPAPASECADRGRNRIYALRIEQGQPAYDLNGDGRISDEDAASTLEQQGIAGEPEVKIPSGSDAEPPNPGGPRARPALTCTVGSELVTACDAPRRLQRTFWQRRPPAD
jgi:type IV pilus assembly protein PilY1